MPVLSSAGIWRLVPGFPRRWQEHSHLSHHLGLPRICLGKKLVGSQSGILTLEPRRRPFLLHRLAHQVLHQLYAWVPRSRSLCTPALCFLMVQTGSEYFLMTAPTLFSFSFASPGDNLSPLETSHLRFPFGVFLHPAGSSRCLAALAHILGFGVRNDCSCHQRQRLNLSFRCIKWFLRRGQKVFILPALTGSILSLILCTCLIILCLKSEFSHVLRLFYLLTF